LPDGQAEAVADGLGRLGVGRECERCEADQDARHAAREQRGPDIAPAEDAHVEHRVRLPGLVADQREQEQGTAG